MLRFVVGLGGSLLVSVVLGIWVAGVVSFSQFAPRAEAEFCQFVGARLIRGGCRPKLWNTCTVESTCSVLPVRYR